MGMARTRAILMQVIKETFLLFRSLFDWRLSIGISLIVFHYQQSFSFVKCQQNEMSMKQRANGFVELLLKEIAFSLFKHKCQCVLHAHGY